MNEQALNYIYQSLKNGKCFGTYMYNVSFPCYWNVLSYDPIKKYWLWRHSGSSAEKATKKNLNWIIRAIFEMSPIEFIAAFDCYDPSKSNIKQ